MTKEKLKSVFQFYLDVLTKESIRRSRFPNANPQHYPLDPQRLTDDDMKQHFMLPPIGELSHLRFMCVESQKFIDAGKIDKAMRWLGFLQGVLWARGIYSLDDLRNHSRPDPVDTDEQKE